MITAPVPGEMYPDADVPVLQASMPTLDPRGLYEIGRKLAPLRDEGVLIMGSGFFTHNLRALSPSGQVQSSHGRVRYWGSETLARGELDALLDFQHQAPAAHQAHPCTEHFAPGFVALGAADGDLSAARSGAVSGPAWLSARSRSTDLRRISFRNENRRGAGRVTPVRGPGARAGGGSGRKRAGPAGGGSGRERAGISPAAGMRDMASAAAADTRPANPIPGTGPGSVSWREHADHQHRRTGHQRPAER